MTMTATALPDASDTIRMSGQAPIEIRTMTLGDIKQALAAGVDDLKHSRTDALIIGAIFPLAGVIFAAAWVVQGILPFIFPLLAGFALLGPLSTLWFATLSRQRELGEESISGIFSEPRLTSIQRLAGTAIMIFFTWNLTAAIIYLLTLGSSNEAADAPFYIRVFTTQAGWELIIIGCAVGAAFALITLAISVISFPVVIDRPVSAYQAVSISVQAMVRNPVFVLGWGVVVVAGLIFGAVTCLLGMVFVLPVLGHATWHVYRRMTG
jgi:uncharacterized membrane protein